MIPVAKDGWRFILPLMAIGIGLSFLSHPFGRIASSVFILLALFCVFFFRDFNRHISINEYHIYSPADGTVVEVVPFPGDLNGEPAQLVRIFLSVFNAHIQRSPITGKVEKIEYKNGRFLDARHPNAHLENAQNALTLTSPKGKVVIIQIAGLIARRIVCWTRPGDKLTQGERYGLIRFGSQVDLVIPASATVIVKKGSRVRAGLSIIAKWTK